MRQGVLPRIPLAGLSRNDLSETAWTFVEAAEKHRGLRDQRELRRIALVLLSNTRTAEAARKALYRWQKAGDPLPRIIERLRRELRDDGGSV